MSQKMTKVYWKKVDITFETNDTIKQNLINVKNKIQRKKQSEVYEIKYAECKAVYGREIEDK